MWQFLRMRQDLPFPGDFHKLTIFPSKKNYDDQEWKLEEAASYGDFHRMRHFLRVLAGHHSIPRRLLTIFSKIL